MTNPPTPQGVTLREALEACDVPEQYRHAIIDKFNALSHPPAPEAAKPEQQRKQSEMYRELVQGKAKPEPQLLQKGFEELAAERRAAKPAQQAQAGEPREFESGKDVQIRRLESALASKEDEYQRLHAHCLAYKEAITKKDAALKACVEAGELIVQWDDNDLALLDHHIIRLKDAIIQAQGALK